MLTPQEVAGCTFAKAVMGGYNMAAVDDFLDKLTEDYAALYKENTELTAKIKTLAAKLEDYKEIEDAMRTTLLTAQKMAKGIVSEAEAKRDAILADAPKAARERMEEIQQAVDAEEQRLVDCRRDIDAKIAVEEARLAAGQAALHTFIDSVRQVCSGELELLDTLPELPVPAEPQAQPAPAGAPQEDAQEDEEDPEVAKVEKDIQEAIAAFTRSGEEEKPQEESPVRDFFAGGSDSDLDSTRVINLDDLQFGRNYTKD